MKVIPDGHDNDSLDCVDDQALDDLSSGWSIEPHVIEHGSTHEAKEMIMRAHRHATVWGTHLGVSRANSAAGWYQQLREWWAAHNAARREARLASLSACWDATHEVFTPRRAEAAPEMTAALHALSVATTLYGFNQ
jgi:hypothetical protein